MERNIMYERLTDSITYYIVFEKSHIGRWWTRFLHKDFAHVYFWRQAGDQTILINPLSHILCVRHCDQTIEQAIENEVLHGCSAILAYTVHSGAHYKPARMGLLTCIGIAKRLLGVRGYYTPKGLYHELLKAGALPIKPYQLI